jgi:hypothetical protein
MVTTGPPAKAARRDPGAGGNGRRLRLDPYNIKVGPAGHLHRERERLASLAWEHFEARQAGATIGAELSGVDLSADLADEVIGELRQALLDYKVLFFVSSGSIRLLTWRSPDGSATSRSIPSSPPTPASPSSSASRSRLMSPGTRTAGTPT